MTKKKNIQDEMNDELPSFGSPAAAGLAALLAKHGSDKTIRDPDAPGGERKQSFDAFAKLEEPGNEERKKIFDADPKFWRAEVTKLQSAKSSTKSKTDDIGY